MARIRSKMLLRDPSPPFHPPSQPHIMMVACPSHCPVPFPMTTLPSPLAPLNVWGKIWGKGSILKQWLDKLGGSAAHRQIGSETRNGKSWLGVLDEIGETIWTNSWTIFIGYGRQWPRQCSLRWKDRTEMDCWTGRWICCLAPHLPPPNSSGLAPKPLIKGNGVRQGQKRHGNL